MSGRGRGRGSRGGGRGGRGRGRGRNNNNNNNTNNSSNNNRNNRNNNNKNGRSERRYEDGAETSRRNNNTKNNNANKPMLKNGEKGAEAHTVSESERIQFTKTLMQLRENPDMDRLEFPPTLTNTERKFLHQLAGQLGLVSKSTGKGENRRIAVTKRQETTKRLVFADGNEANGEVSLASSKLPQLEIGKRGVQALRKHLNSFPPTHAEELESHETGASLVEAVTQAQQQQQGSNGDNDAAIAKTLQQLGLGTPKEAAPTQQRKRYVNLEQRAASHARFQASKKKSPRYNQRMEQRRRLPAHAKEAELVALVKAHPVTIVQGETGCGKSTQCPQFLLDANPTANIVVTQPRRISAISIADRVAQEQCLSTSNNNNSDDDDGNDGIGSLVGYQVRLEAASSKETQLMFVTPGILLRKLQSSPTLNEFTHIVIDEVHERDRYTDFLLIALRDLLPQRPDLRLVLMSATLQTQLLVDYFANYDHPYYQENPPQILEIEGRTFPVQEFFLEDILQLTGYIDPAVAAAASGKTQNGDKDEDNVLSMEALDAELAKLLGSAAAAGDVTTSLDAATPELTVTCPMCGQGFVDALTLGGHVAVCQGTSSANGHGPTDYDDAGDIPLQDYDDNYDVDESAQLHGYDFVVESNPTVAKPEVPEVDESLKWDGTGMFLETTEAEASTTITPEQDALLNHYQTMHDDEQVDTVLLLDVLQYIHQSSKGDGAILVFLPGWQDISEVTLLLESTPPFSNRNRFLILPLHSGIPSSDQRRVLRRPPSGTRKIVLSTNIAETSLTIDDVAFVVDSGRAKEKDYDPHLKTSTLQATWISKASSKQRKGRAGRTKAGVCFHMFSSRRHQSMRPFLESELLRTPLEEMCLFTKKLGLAPGGPEDTDGVPAFLAKAMTPPHEKSISNALDLLVDLGAMLPETNDLTDLGQCLSILSLEPKVGKMVIWSYLLGCAKVTAQMAVSMSYKSPFVLPPTNMRKDATKAQVQLSKGSESDQVTVYNAMLQFDKIKRKSESSWRDFCRRNFLSTATMQMISELRRNITRELSSVKFSDPMKGGGFQNRHQNKEALWQAALAAGLYPNVATRKQGEVNFSTKTNRKCKIHVSSVNAVKGQPLNGKCQVPKGQVEFVCFGEMVKGSHFFTISQTTHLESVLPLLLLSGTNLMIHPDPNDDKFSVLDLDHWIAFKCHRDTAAGLVVLRKRLDTAFLNFLADPTKLGTPDMAAIDRDAVEALGLVLQSALQSSSVR